MPGYQPLYIDIGQGLSMLVGLPTVGSWDNDGRPKNAKSGTLGYNTQTRSVEYWDGTDWFAAKLSIVQ
jgi:hypothetical protein